MRDFSLFFTFVILLVTPLHNKGINSLVQLCMSQQSSVWYLSYIICNFVITPAAASFPGPAVGLFPCQVISCLVMTSSSGGGAVRVRCLPQGHLHTRLGGAGKQTSNLPADPALPPEPHAATLCRLSPFLFCGSPIGLFLKPCPLLTDPLRCVEGSDIPGSP